MFTFMRQASGDPFWASVVLLLNFNGANGSRVYVDSSSYNRAVSEQGTNSNSTAQAKFGTASLLLGPSSSGFLSISDAPSLELGASDFTLEAQIRPVNASGGICKGTGGGPGVYPLSVGLVTVGADRKIEVRCSLDGVTWALIQTFPASGSAFSIAGVWTPIAVVRSGSTLYVFADGILLGTASIAGALHDNALAWCIGRTYDNSFFDGYIDEVRLTIGVARYTANYPPQTAEFTN